MRKREGGREGEAWWRRWDRVHIHLYCSGTAYRRKQARHLQMMVLTVVVTMPRRT